MSTKRKILIAILLVMTLALASLSAYIAFQANKGTGDDVGVTDQIIGCNWCAGPDQCGGTPVIATQFCAGVGYCCEPIYSQSGNGNGQNAACIDPNNAATKKQEGDLCDPVCGNNACDGNGPLGCNKCDAGSKVGQYVCSAGAANASYQRACGYANPIDENQDLGNKSKNGDQCNDSTQCVSGYCYDQNVYDSDTQKVCGPARSDLPSDQNGNGYTNSIISGCRNGFEDNGSNGVLDDWESCYDTNDNPDLNDPETVKIKLYFCEALTKLVSDPIYSTAITAGCQVPFGSPRDPIDFNSDDYFTDYDNISQCRQIIDSYKDTGDLCGVMQCDGANTFVSAYFYSGCDSPTGGGNPSGGGGTNPPPPTGNVRLAGRVYCQDPGGPLLPVQGATVNIFNGTTNSTVTATTDANGRYQRDVSASGQQWFAARLQNVGTGNLSNGQPKSSMTFRDSFCENNSQTGCENSNVACGGAPYYSYEACLTNANETYGNFDFVFQNCTPQFCGDRTCQTGEYCEYAADGQTFVACAGNPAGLPAGTVVNNCRDLSPTAPGNSVPPACTFCGDGVVNGGEQCDPNATGTGGENCNAQCQTVTPVCESLNASVSEDINIGEGNTITYTLRYINAAETNPFPNIALVVENSRGRDFYKPEQTYVQPAEIDNNPSFIPSTSTWVYTFVWEAADTTGTVVTPLTNGGPFDVQILTDYNDTNSVIGNSSCTEQLTLSATTDQPNFVITKTGAEVCTENNDARINYTIRVENISQVEGIIDQVTDTIDQDLVQANLSPTAISPNFGTYSNGVITWIGTEDQRTFDAGEAKTYTYQISIPNSIIERFYSTGIDNRAELEFDENTLEFEVNTEIDCQKIIIPINIPVTAFEDWDPNTLVIMGMLFTLTGAMLYQTGYGEKLFMGGVNIVKDNTRKRKFEKGILEKIRK